MGHQYTLISYADISIHQQTLRKIGKFDSSSCFGNFLETHNFPQEIYTRKFYGIAVFYKISAPGSFVKLHCFTQ